MLGLMPRKKLLKKFALTSSSLKLNGQLSDTFKTDFKTFIKVLSDEIAALKRIEEDISYLLSFMDSSQQKGYISRKELRHLMVEVISPFSLSSLEFNSFAKNISFSSSNDSISIEEFKKRVLFDF
jgi:hypothetical protein